MPDNLCLCSVWPMPPKPEGNSQGSIEGNNWGFSYIDSGVSACPIANTHLSNVWVWYSHRQPKPTYFGEWILAQAKSLQRSETAEMNSFKVKGKIGMSQLLKKAIFSFFDPQNLAVPLNNLLKTLKNVQSTPFWCLSLVSVSELQKYCKFRHKWPHKNFHLR